MSKMATSGLLKGKTVAIIGYGSQGHAHALNLRDSGVERNRRPVPRQQELGKGGIRRAAGDDHRRSCQSSRRDDGAGFRSPSSAILYKSDIKPGLTAGKTLMFAHGFSIHFKTITPPTDVDVSMIAPKAPGHRVRELYTEGMGVPALVAVHQNPSGKALEQALAYALAPSNNSICNHCSFQ